MEQPRFVASSGDEQLNPDDNESGYRSTTVLRPGHEHDRREERRLVERDLASIARIVGSIDSASRAMTSGGTTSSLASRRMS
jgi:hypothetical protein